MRFTLEIGAEGADEAYFRRAMRIALQALVALNCLYLLTHPSTPFLYASHLRYIRDPVGKPQIWKTIPVVLANGGGDCKDLAAWRVAELLIKCGKLAWLRWLWGHAENGRYTLHVQAETFDGIDDPAKVLGMQGNALP